jgi:hypothetical protein
LRYDDPPGEYVFLGYFSSDSETRYIKSGVGAIVDADVSATADIDPTKIFGVAVVDNDSRLTDERVPTDGSVTDAKVDANAAIAYSKLDLAGSVVDADVNASAAIAGTKISPDFGSQNIVTTGDVSAQDAVFSGDAQAASINAGPLAGFRNAIINGNFDIWQRGTSFTGPVYGADRWLNNTNGPGATNCTMSRQAFTLGQTDVPGEPTYFCRMAVTSVAGANHFSTLQHRIEDVRTFAGQTVTVSFYAKADASRPIVAELVTSFGTGGSPSVGDTVPGALKVTISTSWQKITMTTTMPSISGKTLGTNGDSRVALNIWFDAGSNFNSRTDTLGHQSGTFDIAQVQVEAGPVATPFERRPIGTELALCQRYYELVGVGSLGRWNNATTAELFITGIIDKRVVPTVTLASTTNTMFRVGIASFAATGCSIIPLFAVSNGLIAQIDITGGDTPITGEFAALREKSIRLDSEL